MKYKFTDSNYWKLWESSERNSILQTFLDKALIGVNLGFWNANFRPDTAMTPRDNDGVASFTMKLRKKEAGKVLSMRAPLGDSYVRDQTGVSAFSASIPDFIADGYYEDAQKREYKERMFDEFGNDKQLLIGFANEVQDMIDDADQTLNYMSAMLISTGDVDYQIGQGIKSFVYSTPIPAENRLKAGSQTWATSSFKLIDRMIQIEDAAYQRWGKKLPMKWQIPVDMFRNVFMTNEQVLEWVRTYKSMEANFLIPDTFAPTRDIVVEALSKVEELSPIEIIEVKINDYSGPVEGWSDKIAVLRPQGYAGLIKYTNILDKTMHEKYGNQFTSRTFARVGNGGIYTLVNTTLPNGNYKEWHTDLMTAAVPALDEWLYHIIVDTTQTE